MDRRPIQTRSAGWAKTLAAILARAKISPNTISVTGIGFAALAGWALFQYGRTPEAGFLWLAAAGIQLRLLCNMLDGMVAVEGGLQSAAGDLFNDIPDRLEDGLILVPAGYAVNLAIWGPVLGWAAAWLAVMTAYVRLLGGALGQAQDFSGPMAKPHRMFVMTLACLAALGLGSHAMVAGLGLVAAGSIATVGRRVWRLAKLLQAA